MLREETKLKINALISSSIGTYIALNIIAGSGFWVFESAQAFSIWQQILLAVFFLWSITTELWFIIMSWKIFFEKKELFAITLAMQQPRIPVLFRPLLSLWWIFHFLLALVWGLLLTFFLRDHSLFTNLIIAVITSGFAYLTFGYFLLAITVFTRRYDLMTTVWFWRTRWAIAHGLIVLTTKLLITIL